MKIKFTGTPNTDWDGLKATVTEHTRHNGTKHYYVKFFDNGAQLTGLSRFYGSVNGAMNAALGFTTGIEA